MNLKKALSLITTWITALVIGNTCFVNAVSSPCISSEPDMKISQELKEQMAQADDTELIPVGIILKDLNATKIDKLIEQKSNFHVSDYKDIDTYNECILPGIIKEAEEKYGTEAAHLTLLKDPISNEITYAADIYYDEKTPSSKFLSDMKYAERVDYIASKVSDNFKSKLIKENTGMSMITKEVSDNIDAYMSVRRECVTKIYKEYNYSSIKKYISNNNIVINAGFAPFLIVNATKDNINTLSTDDKINFLIYSPDIEFEPELCNSLEKTHSDITQNTNYNYGFTGSGVKVGIIEAQNLMYNSNYCMLSGCQNLTYINGNYGTGSVNDHATIVTSTIKGKAYQQNNKTYKGVAPDSIVYQTSADTYYDIFHCIENLSNYKVSVINMSAGYESNDGYDQTDWIVDCAINNYGFVFVKSAGNNGGYVTSPGNAYNAITVGNCEATGTVPYPIHEGNYLPSSYVEPYNFSNKPDICAPGTDVVFPNSGVWTGTSLSAPIVSGIAAQMIQCMPTLKVPTASPSDYEGRTYYNTVKALILLGANYQIISTTNNNTKMSGSNSNLFRDKSGAGMVDAKKIIDIIRGDGYFRSITNIKMNSDGTSPNGMNSYCNFSQGESLRSVLCFSRIHENFNNITGNYNENDIDLDLTLRDTTNTTLVYSNSSFNNVELIEYQFIANGNYLISAELYGTNNVGVDETLPGALVYYSVEP